MVKILSETTKNPITKIGYMAGVCWGGDVSDDDKNYKRGLDCIKANHGRTLEYVDIETVIEGYSARVIREWYTHIGGAPTRLQESTRYVKWDGGLLENMIIPPTIHKVFEAVDNNVAAPEESRLELAYRNFANSFKYLLDEMEENGVPKEDMAMFYPLGMKTKIVDKRNLRNISDMTGQRLCSRAYWEYRKLMKDYIEALENYSDEWKTISELLFKPKCDKCGFCTENKSCGRKPKK